MDKETQDQVQEDTDITQEVSKEQLDTTENSDSKQYKLNLPDGEKEVSADELYGEYSKIVGNYDRISQENASFRKESEARESKAQAEVAESLSKNELLQNVDPNVKETIIQIVQPVIKEALQEKDRALEQRVLDEAFNREIAELEKEYPGGSGIPKFEKTVVLKAMQEPSNNIFDLRKKFYFMNKKAFDDQLIKEALTKKAGGKKTETLVGTSPIKPQGKTSSSFEDAAKAAYSRLRS